MQLIVYHCEERTSGAIQLIQYEGPDATGEVVQRASVPEAQTRLEDIAPETIGESILQYVCAAAPPIPAVKR